MLKIVLFTLVFINSIHASFIIKNEKDFKQIIFNDYDLLKKLDSRELSYDEFKEQVVSKLSSSFEKEYKCRLLENKSNLPKCTVQEMQERKLTTFIYLPSYYCFHDKSCKSRLSSLKSLKTEINQIFFKENDLISMAIHFQSYRVKGLMFYSSERAEQLKNMLGNLKSFQKDPTHKLYSNCSIKRLTSEGGIGGEPAWELNPLDMDKCFSSMGSDFNMILEMPEVGSYLNIEVSQDAIYDKLGFKEIDSQYLSIFEDMIGEQGWESIYVSLFQHLKSNTSYDLGLAMATETLAKYIFSKFYSPLKIESAISYLLKAKKGVTYNGITGFHEYKDSKLARSVFDLAILISHQPQKLSQYIEDKSLQDHFKDTNTNTEGSRIEPIDLISNMLVKLRSEEERDIEERELSISYKDFIKKYVDIKINDNQEQPSLLIHNRRKKDEGLFLECYNLQASDDFISSFTSIDGISKIEARLLADDTQYDFSCGQIPYALSIKRQSKPSVIKPKEILLKDSYLDVLLPFALTMEVNDLFKNMADKYFTLLGFKIEKSKVSDSSEFVLEEMKSTDVFIPVGHALASRNLEIGTRKSELWVLTREATGNEKYGVRIKILLPEKSEESVSLSVEDLSQSYEERLLNDQNPLFVFLQTCHGEGNLPIWSLIYNQAMGNAKVEDKGLIPYVIASKRGFATSSNVEIAGSVLYLTDLFNSLAQGKSPTDFFNYLKSRKYGKFSDELVKTFSERGFPSLIAKPMIKKMLAGEDSNVPNFEPAYNLSEENIEMTLNRTGRQFTITRNGKEIISSETY